MSIYSIAIVIAIAIFNTALFSFLVFYTRADQRSHHGPMTPSM